MVRFALPIVNQLQPHIQLLGLESLAAQEKDTFRLAQGVVPRLSEGVQLWEWEEPSPLELAWFERNKKLSELRE